MALFFILFLCGPLFGASPQDFTSQEIWDNVSVWYLNSKDGSNTLLLAGTQTYTLPQSPAAAVARFPRQDFIYGHIYNRVNGEPKTNHVLIRKENVSHIWWLGTKVKIVLKKNALGLPADTVSLSKVINRSYRMRRGG